ncbi:MAG: adenylate/guanylate cyclase domain-containing protein, partial [Delftia sp.]|nr:adenylate/guanylate cyclase domain-containing protein [Delftia sp.]
PTIVKRLVEGEQDISLGGKRQQVSVLFADIRGFTAFSESLAPERLIEVLNQYLALAVDAVLAQDGTLDKFMGDAVMALFNAPLPCPDHTWRAVRAALAMQEAIARYNVEGTDHAPLSFGVGIHVGQAVVGNVGTVQQMNYTAIGDAVNLAKRLQEHASGGQIILSQAAYEALKKDVIVQDLGLLAVKGRAATEHAYS